MSMQKDDFNLTDPNQKDKEWAKRVIRTLRWNRLPLTAGKDVATLRAWQNSEYDLKHFKTPYLHLLTKREDPRGTLSEDKADTGIKIDFTRLGLFELNKNILGGEINKGKIHIDADCFDPSIIIEKEKEFDLLKNKKAIQDKVNEMYQGIGVPSDYQIGKQGEFNSNMSEFEGMGLNPENEEDINFFSKTFYRHNLETYCSQMINELNSINELEEARKHHINDIITLKAIAMRTFYNQSTGLPTTEYILPEQAYYSGVVRRNDMKDAISLSYERVMSVSDFLKRVGDEKLTKEDYDYILMYAGMGEAFPGGIDYACNPICPIGMCSWGDFFRFNISVGYIEWKTSDRGENGRYFQKTMKCDYLNGIGLGSFPERIYNYGPLNVQAREGYELELSCFSLNFYRIEGKSMLEIAIPYFTEIFADWLHFQWFMRTSKPKGYAYEINALMKVAGKIMDAKGSWNDVVSTIEMFKASPDMFYYIGDEDSEQKIGGNGLPYQEKPNGIDPTAFKFLETIAWCKNQIMEETGLNNARQAQSPNPDEPNRTTAIVTGQSENATEYITSSMASIYAGSGYRTFAIIQSITEFDLFGIEQLKQIFGEKYIASIKHLKKIPITYYGINIRQFLRDKEREKITQFTDNAVLKGELTEEMGLLINDIDDYNMAAKVLSFYRERTKKQALENQKQIQQGQLQLGQQELAGKLKLAEYERGTTLAKQKMMEDGETLRTEMLIKGKIDQQTQRIQTQPDLNENRSELKKGEDTHKAALQTTQEIVAANNTQNVSEE